ncbi:MAG: FtsX-like permease family protein [Acidobacteria bacterium]|nr:FtsX-like permease family protein [Acidobacteriota bacterium]
MSVFARVRTWWKAVAHRESVRQQVETELEFHIEARAEDLIRCGLSEDVAWRLARAEIGRPDNQNEIYRSAIGLRLFDEVGGDLRYGLRRLLRNPAFSAVAVSSLAIGIGATTAMFSLIYAVLLHPFPYANANRIVNPVIVNEEHPKALTWFAMTRSQFTTLSNANCIESLLGFSGANVEITGGALPEDVFAVYLTENAGSFFGVHPLLGRNIQPSDAQGGGQPEVVLNYRFWERHYHGDRAAIGRTLQVNHRNYTIIGVMPRAFAFNDTVGVGDIYLPHSLEPNSVYIPWIKIRRGVSLAKSDAELGAIVHQFARETPQHFPKEFHLQLQSIVVPYQQHTGRTLYLLLAGVLLVLLIGCANCSVLLLARGAARGHELAMRRALGASRWRIVRQLMVEALVISFTGAALGVAASWWLAELPMRLARSSFPAESVVRINLPILAFSVAVALTCGILFGLAPALSLSRPELAPAIQATVHRIPGQHGHRKLNVLIGAQAAFTLLLMATGAMAIGSFLRVTHIPLGYNPHHVLNAGIMTHFTDSAVGVATKSRTSRTAYFEQIRQRIASVPGVLSVGISIDVYPPYGGSEQKFEMLGRSSAQDQDARVLEVGQNFHSTLQIPLRNGRIWDETENQRGDGVAVVNHAFAERYAPQENPVGLQIRLPDLVSHAPLVADSPASAGWRTIIGVVGDIPDDGLGRPVLPAVYVPYTTMLPPYAQFNIRTKGNPMSYMHALRGAVASVASDQQISRGASSLDSVLAHDPQWSRQRLFSILFGTFSAMALLLALVGIFSVVSYSVEQRTSEFGIRMALGASRTHILWMAARTIVVSAAAGIAVGVITDLSLSRILGQWMNNQSARGDGLFAVTLLLAVCAVAACLIPAGRAATIHPVDALRTE